jgi:rhamnosyltransferase
MASEMKILTLIVTYNGAKTICETIHAAKVQPILVIDNASGDETVSAIRALSMPDVEIISMPENVGVAKAYNIGIQEALKQGKDWLFILDQDSACGEDCLKLLSGTAEYFIQKRDKIAAVCPTIKNLNFSDIIHYPYRWNSLTFEPIPDDGTPLVPIDSTVTSGSLYSVEALNSVGGFREEYFIDFVDHECHLRLRKAGWSLWWDKRAALYHRLGKIQKMTDQGLWIEHEPIRYYYMARNMADGYFRLGGLKALYHFLIEAKAHIFRLRRYGAEPNKSIYYIFKGLFDAFRRKFGRLDSTH